MLHVTLFLQRTKLQVHFLLPQNETLIFKLFADSKLIRG